MGDVWREAWAIAPQIVHNLIPFAVIIGVAIVLYFSLAFFWFQEKISESLFSDIFFTIGFLSIAYFVSTRRAEVAGNVWSAFVLFCLVTAFKLIYQAITRRLDKRFSKVIEKYAVIKRNRKLLRFKRWHFSHLRIKNRRRPTRFSKGFK